MHIVERIVRRAFVHVQRYGGLTGFPVRRRCEYGNVLMPDRPLLVAKLPAGLSRTCRRPLVAFQQGAGEVRAAVTTLPDPAGRGRRWGIRSAVGYRPT